ncbi:chascon isoform d-related [Anaeramoeba flamelloides]|uniref:Chascon isoform d-related n=1 Tax=Anaeramoeba flamelloides TaxID=1746091 RepID=A0AAV7Y4X5_9EUKA|nr:chascon isoform d-related [Anaeramoeba flamelloides]
MITNDSKISIKTIFGNDIRRFSLCKNANYESLIKIIDHYYMISCSDTKMYSLTYLDEEQEMIKFSSNKEFKEALKFATTCFPPLLKITIEKKKTTQKFQNEEESKNENSSRKEQFLYPGIPPPLYFQLLTNCSDVLELVLDLTKQNSVLLWADQNSEELIKELTEIIISGVGGIESLLISIEKLYQNSNLGSQNENAIKKLACLIANKTSSFKFFLRLLPPLFPNLHNYTQINKDNKIFSFPSEKKQQEFANSNIFQNQTVNNVNTSNKNLNPNNKNSNESFEKIYEQKQLYKQTFREKTEKKWDSEFDPERENKYEHKQERGRGREREREREREGTIEMKRERGRERERERGNRNYFKKQYKTTNEIQYEDNLDNKYTETQDQYYTTKPKQYHQKHYRDPERIHISRTSKKFNKPYNINENSSFNNNPNSNIRQPRSRNNPKYPRNQFYNHNQN